MLENSSVAKRAAGCFRGNTWVFTSCSWHYRCLSPLEPKGSRSDNLFSEEIYLLQEVKKKIEAFEMGMNGGLNTPLMAAEKEATKTTNRH